jgi:hypothetical protein
MYNEKDWENLFPVKINQTLQLLQPHAFFVFNKEPIILFFDDSVNNSDTHTACWNFNVTPIIFFVSNTDVKIHNAFEVINVTSGQPLLKELAESKNESNFSYWNLVSGQTFEIYQKQFEGKNRVDKKLLANIKYSRNELLSSNLDAQIANSLIRRLIFVRYLIDRKVRVNFDGTNSEGLLSKEVFLEIIRVKERLYNLFNYLQSHFEGDLFQISSEEYNNISQIHLDILYNLFKGNDKKQLSLFDTYKFDIIPIEFISNIYEYFLGEKQKDQKTYYTPTFLVNYVLNRTVSKHFEENENEITCKVLDPTCGSGIFLIEAFRRIVGQYQKLHNNEITNKSEVLKQIATENIYGIDKDPEAVSVAMFSLYITLLDYQDPKSIENFKFPSLLNKNFFVQDIFNYYDGTLFESIEEGNYIDKLFNTHFQYIIGNPPWGDVKKSPYMEYIDKREKEEKVKIKISHKQFAQAFMVRTSVFCKKDTKCAVVITSKILYNNRAKDFRRYFLNKFFIDEVFELSPISDDVFVNIDTPTTVLFYRYAQNQQTDDNQVTHISIKHNIFYDLLKIFVIEKNDVKVLKQSNFKKYDWIWKVLIYGNALDFQFVKRLKDNFPLPISELIKDENNFLFSTGIIRDSDNKSKGGYDASHLVGMKYLNTEQYQLSPFKMSVPPDSIWKDSFVKWVRDKSIYEPPMLLIKEGVTRYFKLSACVSTESIVFTNSVTSIKSLKNDFATLYCLEGLFHSNIFTYFQLQTGSSVGVQRRRILREELYFFPYQFDENVANLAQAIENELSTNDEKIDFYKIIESEQMDAFVPPEKVQKLRHLYNELNEAIYDLYDVNDIERSLIDYAENVSIPLFHNEERAFRRFNSDNHKELNIYANVFYGHFGKVFNGRKGRYFQIEANYNKFFVCMTFKILDEKPLIPISVTFNEDLGKAGFLANLSLYKEGENLFIQKDIKSFETNEFSIIKPNEIKCWHKALAHKDLFEIREEIIKSSQKQPQTITA